MAKHTPRLVTDEKEHRLETDDEWRSAVAHVPCPHCKHACLRVQGTGRRIAENDREWEADAVSVCCSQPVGVIRVTTDTLFGLTEDMRVQSMGLRIF